MTKDLRLLQDQTEYASVDAVVSQVAIKAFANHLWYLAEDTVPLALFSTEVPPEEKQKITEALSKFEKMHSYEQILHWFGETRLSRYSIL